MIRPTAARKLRSFHDQLMAVYGPQQWWPAQTPLEVIVGAYLTQNTSWRAVERSIANLVAAGVMHLEGLREIPEEELRILIRPSGYMVRKGAAIKAFVAFLDREHGSSLERLAGQPTALCAGSSWRSLAWEKRPRTPFCSTRCFTPLQWWMSICAALPTVMGSLPGSRNTPKCNNWWMLHLPTTPKDLACLS